MIPIYTEHLNLIPEEYIDQVRASTMSPYYKKIFENIVTLTKRGKKKFTIGEIRPASNYKGKAVNVSYGLNSMFNKLDIPIRINHAIRNSAKSKKRSPTFFHVCGKPKEKAIQE